MDVFTWCACAVVSFDVDPEVVSVSRFEAHPRLSTIIFPAARAAASAVCASPCKSVVIKSVCQAVVGDASDDILYRQLPDLLRCHDESDPARKASVHLSVKNESNMLLLIQWMTLVMIALAVFVSRSLFFSSFSKIERLKVKSKVKQRVKYERESTWPTREQWGKKKNRHCTSHIITLTFCVSECIYVCTNTFYIYLPPSATTPPHSTQLLLSLVKSS